MSKNDSLRRSRAVLTNHPPRTSNAVVREFFALIWETELTHAQVAEKAGITKETIRRWKAGLSAPNLTDFSSACEVLGYQIVLQPIDQGQKSVVVNHKP